MPSSLIFAALAGAWLIVLVPMIAKRRREVVRIADSVLASRVLPRQGSCRAAEHDQEVPMMGDWIAERELASDHRQYRPGRGGFDPEAAALAARARYVFRQRVVFGLLGAAILTLLLGFAAGVFWTVHAVLDTTLIGYLCYLRRQVRIEQEVRERRAARMAGSRGRVPAHATEGRLAESAAEGGEPDVQHAPPERPGNEPVRPPRSADLRRAVHHQGQPSRPEPLRDEQLRHDEPRHDEPRHDEPRHEEPPEAEPRPVRRATQAPPPHPTAVAVDVDDDDPMFDELDHAFEPPYRRASGE